MAELVRPTMRDEAEEKRRDRFRKILGLSLVLAFLLILSALWLFFSRRTFKGYTVTSELVLDTSDYTYMNSEDLLMLCNNDGAKALDKNGKVVWEAGYEMDAPALAYCNEVAAIADIGGKQVCVIAENGIPHTYQVFYPIVKLAVAKQGVSAVLLDGGTDDYIQLYDISGSLRVDINTKTKTDGFPVDIALSEDGKKLVTLYMTFQGDSMVSKVTFYNAGEVGKNYPGNIVGQKIFENDFISGINFLGNDTVCVFQEKGFSLYRMTETPSLIFTKEYSDRLLDIVSCEEAVAVVSENSETKNRTMVYYDLSGEEKAIWTGIPEYESIKVSKDEVVLFRPQTVTIYRKNKSIKLNCTFDRNLDSFLFGGGDHYFLIDTGKIQTIKLSEGE